jgi:hypothetical protein
MSDVQCRVIEWPHPSEPDRPGRLEIAGDEYEYAPASAGDLGPDECGRVIVWKTRGRKPATYVCRSYYNGHVSCDCPDAAFRARKLGIDCKHARSMRDLGILGFVAAEPTGQPPW